MKLKITNAKTKLEKSEKPGLTKRQIIAGFGLTIVFCLGIGLIAGLLVNVENQDQNQPIQPEELPESPFIFNYETDLQPSCVISDKIITNQYRTHSLQISGPNTKFYIINTTIVVPVSAQSQIQHKKYALFVKSARSVEIINCTFVAPYQILAKSVVENLVAKYSYFEGSEGIFARGISLSCSNCTFNTSLGLYSQGSMIIAQHNVFSNDIVRELETSTLNFTENYYKRFQLPESIESPINKTVQTSFGEFFVLPGNIINGFDFDTTPLIPITHNFPEIGISTSAPAITGTNFAEINCSVVNWFASNISCENYSVSIINNSGFATNYSFSVNLTVGNNDFGILVHDFANRSLIRNLSVFCDQFAPEIEILTPICEYYGIESPQIIDFTVFDHSQITERTATIDYVNQTGETESIILNLLENRIGDFSWWDSVKNGTAANVTLTVSDEWNNSGAVSVELGKRLTPPKIIVVSNVSKTFGPNDPIITFVFQSNSELRSLEIACEFWISGHRANQIYSYELSGSEIVFNWQIEDWIFADNNSVFNCNLSLTDNFHQFSTVEIALNKTIFTPNVVFELDGRIYKNIAPKLNFTIQNVEWYTLYLISVDESKTTYVSPSNFTSIFYSLSDGNYKLILEYSSYGDITKNMTGFVKDNSAPEICCTEKSKIILHNGDIAYQIKICVQDLTTVTAISESGEILDRSDNGVILIYISDYNSTEPFSIKLIDEANNQISIDIDLIENDPESDKITLLGLDLGIALPVLILGFCAVILITTISNSIKLRRRSIR